MHLTLHGFQRVNENVIDLLHTLLDLFPAEVQLHENLRTLKVPFPSMAFRVFIARLLYSHIGLMRIHVLGVLEVLVVKLVTEPGEPALVFIDL